MKPQTEITDFRKVLELAVTDSKSILVGGHAVNVWALFYFHRIEMELRQFLPFTSKDIDFYGEMQFLDRLVNSFGGSKSMSQPRGPVIGRVDLEIDGVMRIVEVLHSVHGLSPKDLARSSALVIEVGQCRARVLDPVSLLKAKIHNAADLKQEDRNDVRHVKIMILCVREFILDALDGARTGSFSQRNLVNILESVYQVISESQALKAQKLWSFDYHNVWPVKSLKASGLTKVINFLEHRKLAS